MTIHKFPADWGVKSLASIPCEVIDCHHSTPVWTSSGFVVIRNQNIRNGKLDLSEQSFTDATHYRERIRRAEPTAGDIVITREAPMGQVCMIPKDLQCCLGQRMVLLRSTESSAHGNYLLYALQSEAMQRYIAVTGGTGSTVSNLRIPVIKTLPIPLPSGSEQLAITAALSDIDALIAGLEKLIAKKRNIKQAAMQQLLTGQTRLTGFSGEWKYLSLGELCSLKSGTSITSSGISDQGAYRCFGGNGLRGYTPTFTHNGSHALIGRQGALCGNVVGVQGKFFASEHALVVTPRIGVAIEWLTFVLGRMNLNQYSESSAQPGLSAFKLLILEVLTPPSEAEQAAIAEALAFFDAELTALESRLTKTRDLKQGMMQELLTGRTRLV